jgi:peptidoglycan/LPS O-acetylase OafA/YrhL
MLPPLTPRMPVAEGHTGPSIMAQGAYTGMPRSKTARKEVRIGGLDLLRAFAGADVLFFHLAVTSWLTTGGANHVVENAPQFPELVTIFRSGWVGVEVFFVISGFVIANSAESRNSQAFIRSRIGRLVPAVLICATATLLLVFFFGPCFTQKDLGSAMFTGLSPLR